MYHVRAGEPVRWKLLDPDEADAAETLEQSIYKTSVEEAQDFKCATIGCRQQLSFYQMRQHMRMRCVVVFSTIRSC